MNTERYMDMLKAISTAKQDLFPLNADELDEIESKAKTAPKSMTDNELFLLAVANLYDILWEIYDRTDPENGDNKFYEDLFNYHK